MLNSKPGLLATLCVLLFILSGRSVAQTRVIPYQQLPTSTGAPTGSGIYFGATMTTSNITIQFEGPMDRWIALGFGSFMEPTDVFIYSIGHALSVHPLGWYDYYNSSYSNSGILADATQNWTVVSTNTVSPGQRTITATRALNTGDPNDVAFNFTATALSLVWAKGATPDYTIAYHGSTNRAFGISLPWLSAPSASFTTASTTLCAGTSLTYSNLSTGGQTSYTWAFQSGSPATSTSTNPIISYSTPGTYSVVLTTSNAIGTSTVSQMNYITVTPTVSPSLSINLASGSNPICSGVLATFTASPVNGGSSPSYQWKVNGLNAGTNSSTFTSTGLTNPSTVTCIMSSNAVCPSPASATSAAITMTVNSSAPASVSIGLAGGTNPICNGAIATYTANAGNGGASPAYQWQVNGVNAGANSSTFTINTLSSGDVITCVLSSNAPCASSTLATSSGITMTVSSVLVPSVSILLSAGTNPMCAGSSVTFSANAVNGGATPVWQWKINGLNTGANSPVFTSTSLNAGDLVSCQMISGSSCASPSSAISGAIQVTVNAIPPAPSVSPSGTVIICAGTNQTLTSSAATGNVWSTGSTSQSIVITAAGNYTVTQTVNGCTSPPSSVIHASVFTIANATLDPVNSFCLDSPPFQLLGMPPGGNYAGPGVIGSMFNPAQANTGDNNIIIYTNFQGFGNTTCADTAAIRITVLDCTGIPENSTVKYVVSVYPNPGAGEFIADASPGKIKTLCVKDLTGRTLIIKNCNKESQSRIDLKSYPAGIYILEIQLESQVLRSRIQKTE